MIWIFEFNHEDLGGAFHHQLQAVLLSFPFQNFVSATSEGFELMNSPKRFSCE